MSLLPPANEICEGNVFTGVCLSAGEGANTPLGRHTLPLPGQTHPAQTHPWADAPWADTPPGRQHPWADTPWADIPRQTPLDRHPPGQIPPGQKSPGKHPWADTPTQCMLGYKYPSPSSACWDINTPHHPVHAGIHSPPAQCMLGYNQLAGGTHSTRMHSCW